MKKETLIAVVLGLAFGGILAVIISLKSKDLELAKNKVIAPPQEKVSSANPSGIVQTLELSQPEDKEIFDTNVIHLKGTAEKGALIVIQSPIKDLVVVNKEGAFDLEFPLALGENSIKVVVYPKEKQFRSQEKSIKVYYIDSEL